MLASLLYILDGFFTSNFFTPSNISGRRFRFVNYLIRCFSLSRCMLGHGCSSLRGLLPSGLHQVSRRGGGPAVGAPLDLGQLNGLGRPWFVPRGPGPQTSGWTEFCRPDPWPLACATEKTLNVYAVHQSWGISVCVYFLNVGCSFFSLILWARIV